jgi:PAS domain S-box-containing protein
MAASTVSLLISSAIQIAGALVFAIVLWYFQRREDRSYLRFWTWSWLAFVVYTTGAVASRLIASSHPPTTGLRIGLSIVSLGAGYLQVIWLLLGTYEFSRRRLLASTWLLPAMAVALVLGVGLTFAWIADPAAGNERYFARMGVRVFVTGLAFAVAAVWMAREGAGRGSLSSWLLPVALLLYGVSQVLTFLWALPVNALAIAGDTAVRMALGTLDVFLQLLIGLGMLLWMLERERDARRADWARMAESEERYRTLAESATDAIVTLEMDGRIAFANPAAATTFGYSLEELTGQSVAVLMPEDDRETYLEMLERFRQTGARQLSWSALRLTARHKSGRDIPVEVSLTEHAAAGVRRITGIVRDLSERQRLAEQMLQAQKMQAVDRLAGGIAHDFNNLLMAIGGHAELTVTQLEAGHPARSGLLEIRRAAERATDLTTRLLSFSRKQPLLAQRLDLNVVVSELGAMLARLISEDIAIEIRLVKEAAYADADPGLLDQVLLNLAINARDAMPGGGRLTLATTVVDLDDVAASKHAQARPGSFVCVRVTDTGSGIQPEHLPNIFDPFFTTKDIGKGTGLGLATTYGVTQQHDGWIEVESVVGLGTTFRLFLPRQEAPAETFVAPPPPVLAHGRRETILLVEDEAAVRAVIQRVLTGCGYTVIEAVDGPAGLAMWDAQNGRIDLLLTDVVMPRGMTGPDLAAELRRRNPHLRVIFMTGYQGQTKLEQMGVETPLLRKPFSLAELTRTVQDCLAAPPLGNVEVRTSN